MSADPLYTQPDTGRAAYSMCDAEVERAYHDVLTSWGVFESNYGVLQLIGEDCLDFLQRLSTNDLNDIVPGSQRSTTLTTEKGRVVDIVTVLHLEQELLLLTTLGRRKVVREWLEHFIITERVEIIDVTQLYKIISVAGPHAESQMKNIFMLGEIESPEFIIRRHPSPSNTMIGIQDTRWSIPKYDVLVKSGASYNEVRMQLNIVSKAHQPAVKEILRVEQRVVSVDSDIDANTNPLEARLDAIVSFTKGCYIGQEVIARLDSYKKLQRILHLVQFSSSAAVLSGPGSIYSGESRVGWTTSHVWSYHHKGHIAMGYVKIGILPDALEYRSDDSSFRCDIVAFLPPLSFPITNLLSGE